MLTDVILLLGLILLNGVFAMSEIAIVSSRRTRLLQMADAGDTGARHALKLASEPTRFLSSVQVGITSIGILNGAIGEASIASRLRTSIEHVPVLGRDRLAAQLAVLLCLPLGGARLLCQFPQARPSHATATFTMPASSSSRGSGIRLSSGASTHLPARCTENERPQPGHLSCAARSSPSASECPHPGQLGR